MKTISGAIGCHVMAFLVLASFVVFGCEAEYVAKDAGPDSSDGQDGDEDVDGGIPGDEDGGTHEYSDAVWPEDFDSQWPDDLKGHVVVTLKKHIVDGSTGAIAVISLEGRDVTTYPAGLEGTNPEPVGVSIDELSRIGYPVYLANKGTGSLRMLDLSKTDPLGGGSAAVLDPGDPPEVVSFKFGSVLAVSGKSNIFYTWDVWNDTTQAVPLGESGVTLWDMTRKDWGYRTYIMDNTGTASGRGSIFIFDYNDVLLGRVSYEDLETDSSGPLMAAVSPWDDENVYVVNSHTDNLSYFLVDGDSLVHVSDHPLAPSDFNKSRGITVSSRSRRLFLLADGTHEVLSVSTTDFSIERFPLDKTDNPNYLAITADGKYLLVPSPINDCIYVLDSESGQPVLTIPLPESSEPGEILDYW